MGGGAARRRGSRWVRQPFRRWPERDAAAACGLALAPTVRSERSRCFGSGFDPFRRTTLPISRYTLSGGTTHGRPWPKPGPGGPRRRDDAKGRAQPVAPTVATRSHPARSAPSSAPRVCSATSAIGPPSTPTCSAAWWETSGRGLKRFIPQPTRSTPPGRLSWIAPEGAASRRLTPLL